MRMRQTLEYAMRFASFVQEHNVKPYDLAEVVQAVHNRTAAILSLEGLKAAESGYLAGVKTKQRRAEMQVATFCTKYGFEADYGAGYVPTLKKNGTNCPLPVDD